jgi:hypothetical protein
MDFASPCSAVGEVIPLIFGSKEAYFSWDNLAEMLRTAIEFSVPFICEEIAVHRVCLKSFDEERKLPNRPIRHLCNKFLYLTGWAPECLLRGIQGFVAQD